MHVTDAPANKNPKFNGLRQVEPGRRLQQWESDAQVLEATQEALQTAQQWHDAAARGERPSAAEYPRRTPHIVRCPVVGRFIDLAWNMIEGHIDFHVDALVRLEYQAKRSIDARRFGPTPTKEAAL